MRHRKYKNAKTHPVPVRAVPGALKLVKDAVVFIKGTQLAAEVIVNLEGNTQRETVQTSRFTAASPPGMDSMSTINRVSRRHVHTLTHTRTHTHIHRRGSAQTEHIKCGQVVTQTSLKATLMRHNSSPEQYEGQEYILI